MVKPEVIRRRLDKLDAYLTYLEKVGKHPRNKFLDNTEIWASAERFLQMAIESVNDMASHIISEENLGTVDQYRDIPEIFYRDELIDNELKNQWIRMIGFRNILVHGYTEIDRTEVYNILNNHLDDIKSLRKKLANFL